ncbi:hypothetical protein TUM12370_12890 [Salmonella enterica subsp. enterica serovar Choleraesuis]|nr:hypothetical protein TUM12370_12890 [Salmonella enterica subsp. enterica serovar Choleraesuis]
MIVANNMRLAKNILALVAVQFTNYIAPLLVLPYLTRTLSVEQFGVVVLSFSICSIALIVTDFGFGLSGSYWISLNSQNKKKVAEYIGGVLIFKVLLVIIILIAISAYLFFWQPVFFHDYKLLAGILFTVLFQSFQIIWFFQGIEKMKNVTMIMVSSKIVYVISIMCLVNTNNESGVVLICLAGSALISAILSIIRVYKESYAISIPNVLFFKEIVSASLSFFISRAAVGIYTSASAFIVGTFSGLQQAALYSSAEKLYQAGQSASSPISQALFPYLTRSKDSKMLYKFIIVLLPLLILMVGVCEIYAQEILRIFYGEKYIDAVPVLRVFLITSVFTFVSVNIGYPAFAIYDKLKLVNLSVYIAAVMHFFGLIFLYLTDNIHALSVAICVCIVECMVLIMRIVMFTYIRNKNAAIKA